MPRVHRSADVTWSGNVARGEGRITAATGAFDGLPYTLASRVAAPEGKTSPEELLAAAHAACYAMSLAGELAGTGTPPDRVEVRSTVTLDEVDGSHRIVGAELHARARVGGMDADAFARVAHAADESCPFSALIKASGTVTVNAEIEGGSGGD
ncbi:MAG: OsmC family peroxiredoxin [Acidobacteria bacterium]|nr:OsmC family peroxiredoxin [Acidobacteriota bacterium]